MPLLVSGVGMWYSTTTDVLISNWALGKTAACDISVTSPLNSNIISEAGVTAGAAAQATELRKHEANDVKCSELGWLCIPLVVESYGAWGKEAMESFSSLASRLAITSSRPKSAVLSELYGRLNLNLVLSNKIDNHLFNILYEQSSAADRARLLSVSSPHAASWVSVIPSEGLGLHLQPSEFQCGGDVVTHHNKLRDTLAETCRRAHLSVKVEAGSNLTKDHSHTRPADILVPNWSMGNLAAFYLSPLNSNVLLEAGLAAGQAARATEQRKHDENDAKCKELGWICVPMVVEAYGAWVTEAMESFSLLASRLATSSNRAKAEVLAALYGRLNLNLVRANVTAILFRRFVPDY
eukprot:Em0014g140a